MACMVNVVEIDNHLLAGIAVKSVDLVKDFYDFVQFYTVGHW